MLSPEVHRVAKATRLVLFAVGWISQSTLDSLFSFNTVKVQSTCHT